MNVQHAIAREKTRDQTIWNSFEIRYSFPVVFTEDLFDPANTSFADAVDGDPARLLVILDDGVAAAHPDLSDRIRAYVAGHSATMTLALPPQTVAGGEAAKTDPSTLAIVQDLIHEARIDRHSYVVAIGGGAILDMVGLAAATAHRGVRHIRVPTTVLSQNDSGVGVKNAVNFKGIKNYTGTFAPPAAVLNDHGFIEALPERERIAGIAEAVKVALIRDAEFFEWIEANAADLRAFAPRAERHMIRHCAALHIRQISQGGDPFETGSARPLDYGHWSAHKLEALTGHALRHGEAVAIGIALDARYSVLSGLLPEGSEDRVVAVLQGLGLGIYHPALEARGPDGRLALLAGLAEFREHLGGRLTITLLDGLGSGIEVHEMDEARIVEAIGWLARRSGASR